MVVLEEVGLQGQCLELSKSDTSALPQSKAELKSLPSAIYFSRVQHLNTPSTSNFNSFPGSIPSGPRALVQTGSSVLQSLLPYKPAQLCPTQNAAAKNVFLACHPDNSNPFSDAPPPSQLPLLHNLTLLVLNKAARRRADSFLISP